MNSFCTRHIPTKVLVIISIFSAVFPIRAGDSANTVSTVIADFEKDRNGFTGSIEQDTDQAKNGKGSGLIEADLSNAPDAPWSAVYATKELAITNPILEISLWVKTTDAHSITIRIDDSAGESHQVSPPIEPNGQWQLIKIASFTTGPGYQTWGGPNDKTVHWPAKAICLVAEKTCLKGGKGSIWVDDLTVTTAK